MEKYQIKKHFKFTVNEKVSEMMSFLQYLQLSDKAIEVQQKDSNQYLPSLESSCKEYFKKLEINLDTISDVSVFRQRFIKQIQNCIIDQQEQIIEDFQANFHYKNIIYLIMHLNHFILKLQQFFVQEELEIGRPIKINNVASGQIKNWKPQG